MGNFTELWRHISVFVKTGQKIKDAVQKDPHKYIWCPRAKVRYLHRSEKFSDKITVGYKAR